MKTAFLFGSLNRGGTETLLLDVCNTLKSSDFDAVGIYRKTGALEEEFKKSTVPFTKLSINKNPISYIFRLRKFIKSNDIDILHSQQPIDAFLGLIASIGLKKKHVLTFHGFDFDQNKLLVSFIIHRTDLNIFVSNYQKSYYSQKYDLNPEKQTVIYNGVDLDKFNIEIKPNYLRNELNLDNNTLLLGMVGNFNQVRDQMTVCRFLKLLNNQQVDFHFVFVGKRDDNNPERFDNCIKYCTDNNLSDNVSFLGKRDDVPSILNQLDAFVYSTEHDTFGIAVVEAMAVGIPVFVNDWDVMKEITEDGTLAILYKTADESDLLNKFILFLQNNELYNQQALSASEVIKSKYTINNHINNLKQAYNQLNNNHHP